jgi:ABC-2 type transport system permease protein
MSRFLARRGATMFLRLIAGAARAQVQITRHNIENLLPVLTVPLSTLVAVAILVHSGRQDLAGWALVASLVMTIGQMGFLVASEIVANERHEQTLELIVASPAPYLIILVTRVVILTSIGLVGFAEAWLIARAVFHISVVIYHPALMLATVLLTTFAAAGTIVIATSLFCFGRTTRTFQNAVSGPLYLLGGVLVPVTFLPHWIQPVSRIIFFYWAADLLRDSLQLASPHNVFARLAAIFILGIVGGGLGALLLGRMFDHLKREGTLGL